jgi:hypothetical protein
VSLFGTSKAVTIYKKTNKGTFFQLQMSLTEKISNITPKMGAGKHDDLEVNKLYPIIGATRKFSPKIVLLYRTSDERPSILSLNKKYSDAFTNADVEDIHIHRGKYFLVYKKIHAIVTLAIILTLCRCNNTATTCFF